MKQFLIKLAKVAATSATAVIAGITALFISMMVLTIIALSMAGDGVGDATGDQEFVYGDKGSSNKFLQVDVNGLILGEPEELGDFFGLATGVTYGYEIKDQLLAAAKEKDIDGIILYVNSPGGTIYGSKAIADGVHEYKAATGKPVLAFVSGMAASGGYWAVSAADEIVADAGTTIGSIGVIYGPFKYYDTVTSEDGGLLVGGVVTQNGIESTYISAGKSKDMGNPYRRMTAEEQVVVQSMVNDSYQDFVATVAVNRQLEPKTIVDQLGAFIFSEHAAVTNGLIDSIASKQGAYEKLGDLAGVTDDFQVLRVYREPGFLQTLMQAYSKNSSPSVKSSGCPLATLPLAFYGDVSVACGL